MRKLVSQRPELMYHWTFEGRYEQECLTDKLSGTCLEVHRYPERRRARASLAQYGPDRSSRSLQIAPLDEKHGIAAISTRRVKLTRECTAELLFRADDVRPGEFNKGWILFAGADGGNRIYLAGVSRFRPILELIAGFGTASPFHPAAEVVITDQKSKPAFRLHEWYYLAVTYSHNRRSGVFTINAFLGRIDEGGELLWTVRNVRRRGTRGELANRRLFIGCAGDGGQFFNGAVDEIAIYDRVLPREVLHAHFLALKKAVPKEKEISLMLSKHAPVFHVSKELAEQHANAYTKEWQHTSPDLVVFIPEAETGAEAENQHFIVLPLKNGNFFAVWTSAYRESHPNQHIVFSKSNDEGVTWTKPVTIAGPNEHDDKTDYEGLASWGFPIYVPRKNRIYVFYNKGIGIYDPHRGSTGEMRFVYSDDEGKTWSREYTVRMRRTAIMAPDPKIPPNWIIWQMPVEITPGQIIGCGTVWSSGMLAKEEPNALLGSECWFWLFDNILTEDNPSKIHVTMLPDGDHGIRMPNAGGSNISTAEEPTVVRLSDGRWFTVFRTFRGCIGYAISKDEGHSWSEAEPLLYRDGGEEILQPTASCPLYPLGNGKFLLTFHNNDGTANGGKDPWDWRRNRTPAFYSIGKEMLNKEQPIWFTRPIMFLNNQSKQWGPSKRTSVAVYTSFFCFGDRRYYWYPDRKHFLLGKFITDEMVREAESLGW